MTNEDSGIRLSVAVARVAAWSQPFYPLYLYIAAGSLAWPAFVSLASTPFFGAVPWLAGRHPTAARHLVILTGVINTTLCMIAMGEASLVFAYLGPILLLAMLIFSARERWSLAILLAACIAIVTVGHLAASVVAPGFTPAESRALATMHLASAAGLTALILFMNWRGARPATAAPPRH